MSLKRILSIALLSIKASFRDPYYAIWNLIVPVALFLVFVNIFAPTTEHISMSVFVYNLDNSTMSKALVTLLNKSGLEIKLIHARNVNIAVEKAITESITKGDYPRLLVIPRGFGENLTKKGYATVILYALEEDWKASIVSQVVDTCIQNLTGRPSPVQQQISYTILKPVKTSYIHALERLTLSILISGLLVAWLIGGACNVASLITHFRTTGYVKRLKVTNVRPHELHLGLTLGTLLVYIVTSMLILIACYITRDVTIRDPVSYLIVLLAMVIMIFFASSIGLTVGVLARVAEYSVPMTVGIVLILMFISGYAIPLTLLPEDFKKIALLLPTTYALLALKATILYTQHIQALQMLAYPAATAVTLSITAIAVACKKI